MANFSGADLSGVDLSGAELEQANFRKTNLSKANLSKANLSDWADFRGANLSGADLGGALLFETVFADVDLSATKGLDLCHFEGPSILDHRTLQRSGRLPETFLRGCGFSDWQIQAAKLHEPRLTSEQIEEIIYRIHDLRSTRPIQIHNLFISYSHADGRFIDHIERHLDKRGIRFWRDIYDAPAGPLEKDRRPCHSSQPNGIACALRKLRKE